MRLLFLFALPAFATTTLTVLQVTAEQAEIRVVTTQGPASNCTVRAYEGTAIGVGALVNDVNPALFAGSNLGNRATTISVVSAAPTATSEFKFVLGLRQAQNALDGTRQSRALVNSTMHIAGFTCGSDAEVTTTFTTGNPDLGVTFQDARFDRTHPGEYAYPSMPWTARGQEIVDPTNGVKVTLGTLPGDLLPSSLPQSFQANFVPGTGWTGSGQGPWTYSGTSQGFLYLPASILSTVSGSAPLPAALSLPGAIGSNADWMTAALRLSGTLPGVNIYLTRNGVTPIGKAFSQAITSTPTNYTAGSTTPVFAAFTNSANPPVSVPDIAPQSSSVVKVGATLTWASGQFFRPDDLTNGSIIELGPTVPTVPCAVASVQSDKQLILQNSACIADGTLAALAQNFGILIQASTNANGTITLATGASWTLGSSGVPTMPSAGFTNVCSPVQSLGPASAIGFPCAPTQAYGPPNTYSTGNPIFWLGQNGTVTLAGLSTLSSTPTGLTSGVCGNPQGLTWDGLVAGRFYCLGSKSGVTAYQALVQVDYSGAYPASNPTFNSTLPSASGTTLSNDLNAAVASFDGTFAAFAAEVPGGVPGWTIIGWQSNGTKGAIVLNTKLNGQDSPGWWAIWSLDSSTVIAAWNTYTGASGALNRWCGDHSGTSSTQFPFVVDTCQTGGTYGLSGQFTIGTSGTLGAAPWSACPANPFGITGNNCSNLTLVNNQINTNIPSGNFSFWTYPNHAQPTPPAGAQFKLTFPGGSPAVPGSERPAQCQNFSTLKYLHYAFTAPSTWTGPLTGAVPDATTMYYSTIGGAATPNGAGIQFNAAFNGVLGSDSDPTTNAFVQSIYFDQDPCFEYGYEFGFYRLLQNPGNTTEQNTVYFYYANNSNCLYDPGTMLGSCRDRTTGVSQPVNITTVGIPVSGVNSHGGTNWIFTAQLTSPTNWHVTVVDPYNGANETTPVDFAVQSYFTGFASSLYTTGLSGYTTITQLTASNGITDSISNPLALVSYTTNLFEQSLTPIDAAGNTLVGQTIVAGDSLNIGNECFQIATLSGTSAVIGRGQYQNSNTVQCYNPGAHPANSTALMIPNGMGNEHWVNWGAPLNDVHGASQILDPISGDGHYGYASSTEILGNLTLNAIAVPQNTVGKPIRLGALPANITNPFFVLNHDATFSTATPETNDNYCGETHPSNFQTTDTGHYIDNRPYMKCGNPATATLIGTYTYLVPAAQLPNYNYRIRQWIVTSGTRIAVDVSGPGSVLHDTQADWYKYCYPLVANECVTGSVADGRVYVNLPYVSTAGWYACRFRPPTNDISIDEYQFTMQAVLEGSTQAGWDPTGQAIRILTTAFTPACSQSVFWNSRETSGFVWTTADLLGGAQSQALYIQKPPTPAQRSTNNATYIPFKIKLPGISGDTVRVQYGYAEYNQGSLEVGQVPGCHSRNDSCWSNASGATPFLFGSETPSPTSCGSGCTVTLNVAPAPSGRIVYYQVFRTNASVTTTSPVDVAVIR